jgi:hypothetical protein
MVLGDHYGIVEEYYFRRRNRESGFSGRAQEFPKSDQAILLKSPIEEKIRLRISGIFQGNCDGHYTFEY